jgi:hydroxyacylglutathione hydrolase
MIEVHQFPVLSDNYAFLVRCRATSAVATIDTPDGEAILAEAARLGWTITDIWNTHWHPDHAGGNAAIIAATNARVTGPAEVARIGAMPDQVVAGGETVRFGRAQAKVIDVGGHTLGHVAFWFEGAQTAFVGDTIFALGCGRLFEGTAEQMWASLQRLMALPDETTLYCAHEYTASNLRYALHVDPDNAELQARGEVINRLRAAGLATVPMTLAQEKATNPFLRAGAAARFGELRAGKDAFRG